MWQDDDRAIGSEALPLAPSMQVPAESRDDFYCVRYQVWYASVDCAFRTKYDTAPGCRGCEQGRFNLRRHESRLAPPTWARLVASRP